MSTLTIRLPDDTAQRLKDLAHTRGLGINKLMEELSTQAIAAFDMETRFRTLAASGDPAQALAILDRLDQQDANAAQHCRRCEPGEAFLMGAKLGLRMGGSPAA